MFFPYIFPPASLHLRTLCIQYSTCHRDDEHSSMRSTWYLPYALFTLRTARWYGREKKLGLSKKKNRMCQCKSQDILIPNCRRKKNRAYHKYKNIIAMMDCLVIQPEGSPSLLYSSCIYGELGFFSACSPGLVYLGPESIHSCECVYVCALPFDIEQVSRVEDYERMIEVWFPSPQWVTTHVKVSIPRSAYRKNSKKKFCWLELEFDPMLTLQRSLKVKL